MITMEAIEAYRTAGGREEHHARKEALQNEIENTQELIDDLRAELKRVREKWTEESLIMEEVCRANILIENRLEAWEKQEPIATMHESHDAVWFSKGCDDHEYRDDIRVTFLIEKPKDIPAANSPKEAT